MSNKVKFTPEQKMFFVLKFRELKISLAEFCRLYNVERTAIHRWSIKYDNEGLEGLKEIKKPTKYPSHVLINSVKDYLTGILLRVLLPQTGHNIHSHFIIISL